MPQESMPRFYRSLTDALVSEPVFVFAVYRNGVPVRFTTNRGWAGEFFRRVSRRADGFHIGLAYDAYRD